MHIKCTIATAISEEIKDRHGWKREPYLHYRYRLLQGI